MVKEIIALVNHVPDDFPDIYDDIYTNAYFYEDEVEFEFDKYSYMRDVNKWFEKCHWTRKDA